MNENPTTTSRIPFGIFFGVFIFVFTLVLGISIVSTSLMPKTYMSEAQVEVRYKPGDGGQNNAERRTNDSTLAQTESEVIHSEVIMRKVIGDLNLNAVWGKKYLNADEELKTWETLVFLKHKTSIRPVPETTLIQICAFDDNPDDAALIANGIAKAYTSYVATNSDELQVQLIDSAYANKFPSYPNKPLNYFLGVLIGIFLGLLAGVGIALIVFLKNRKASQISES
jgi:capsular polysaccharide biosynthesis protein